MLNLSHLGHAGHRSAVIVVFSAIIDTSVLVDNLYRRIIKYSGGCCCCWLSRQRIRRIRRIRRRSVVGAVRWSITLRILFKPAKFSCQLQYGLSRPHCKIPIHYCYYALFSMIQFAPIAPRKDASIPSIQGFDLGRSLQQDPPATNSANVNRKRCVYGAITRNTLLDIHSDGP